MWAPPRVARDGDVDRHAAEVRRERVGLRERGDGPPADEIDDRVTEAECSHGPKAIFRGRADDNRGDVRARRSARLPPPRRRRPVPILYLHGLPTSSDDWIAPLELGGGIAVDLPGFGRSGKRGDLDYSLAGHVAFLERLLDELGSSACGCACTTGAPPSGWRGRRQSRARAAARRRQRRPAAGGLSLARLGARDPAAVRRPDRGRLGDAADRAPDLAARVGRRGADVRGLRRERRRALRPRHRARAAAAAAQRVAGVARRGRRGLGRSTRRRSCCGARATRIAARFGAGYAASLGDATLETSRAPGTGRGSTARARERIVGHLTGDPPAS